MNEHTTVDARIAALPAKATPVTAWLQVRHAQGATVRIEANDV